MCPHMNPEYRPNGACRFCKTCDADLTWNGQAALVCAYCLVERRFSKDIAEHAYGEFHHRPDPFPEERQIAPDVAALAK